jgi:hypothetical protein
MIGPEPLVKFCGLSTPVNVLFQSSCVRSLASNARSTPGVSMLFASPERGIVAQRMPFDVPFDERDIMPPGIPCGGSTLVTDCAGVLKRVPLNRHMRPKSFSPQV